MEMLREEANANSPPATEQPGLCMRAQVTASPGGRGDGGSRDGAGEQLPGGQGLTAPDVPRLSTPSPTAGAQSQGPAPHSPCCPPGPSAPQPGALREPCEGAAEGAELPGPQTAERDLATEEKGKSKPNVYQDLFGGEDTTDEEPSQENVSDRLLFLWELSEGEVRLHPALSPGREEGEVRLHPALPPDTEDKKEDWEQIAIHTIWVNPKYPELLQDPDAAPQDSAKAAAPPASAEQGKAAGAQSQGPAPHSPCCPPGPSAPQPGALGQQPAPPKERPSRFRRALLRCPCLRPRPDE